MCWWPANGVATCKDISRVTHLAAQNVITVICAHFVGGHRLAHGWSVPQGRQARERVDYPSGSFSE